MAQPFLIAMSHSEWQSGNILRKHHQRRPLGSIEREYRYMPRQPVLSSRTVDVDLTGTRTYRAKSAGDIIEEQHKLIHTIYCHARTDDSSYTQRDYNQHGRGSDKSLRFLTVQGRNRPETSPSLGRPVSSSKNGSYLSPQKRPHTTGSRRPKIKPATETILKLQVDPDLLATTEALYELNELVKGQWKPENHALDEGFFVRGKKKNTSLDPKTGSQWLTFGGGQEGNTGVVGAFTGVETEEKLYTMEGSTGSQVVKKLKHRDKVLIGINGRERSSLRETSSRQLMSTPRGEATPADLIQPAVTPRVPLCWTDQMDLPDTKIMEPSTPRPVKPKPNLCESQPVIFNKVVGKKSSAPGQKQRKGKSSKAHEGYHIKARTKKVPGWDGSDSSSTITDISIVQSSSDTEGDKLTYDDILALKVNSKDGESRMAHGEFPYMGEAVITSKEHNYSKGIHRNNPQTEGGEGLPRKNSGSLTDSQLLPTDGLRDRRGSIPNSRPDSVMMESHLDNLVISGAAPVQTNEMKSPTQRASSGKHKSSPTRTIQPKSNAVHGNSSGTSLQNREASTSYIQIAHQIHLSKEPSSGSNLVSSGPDAHMDSDDLINSVREYNKGFNKPPSPVLGRALSATSVSKDQILYSKETIMEATPVPLNSPPSSASSRQDPDVFAVNIPTADPEEPEENTTGVYGRKVHSAISQETEDLAVEQTATRLASTNLDDTPGDQPDDVNEHSLDTNEQERSTPRVASAGSNCSIKSADRKNKDSKVNEYDTSSLGEKTDRSETPVEQFTQMKVEIKHTV